MSLKTLTTSRLEILELTRWATERGLPVARLLLEPIRAALHQRKNKPERQQTFPASVRKSFWTRDGVWKAAHGDQRECQLCQAARGTRHHGIAQGATPSSDGPFAQVQEHQFL